MVVFKEYMKIRGTKDDLNVSFSPFFWFVVTNAWFKHFLRSKEDESVLCILLSAYISSPVQSSIVVNIIKS